MAGVVHRRVVDGRPRVRDMLERHHQTGDLAVIGRAGGTEAGPLVQPGRGLAHGEQPCDVNRAELLGETLDPTAIHRKVLVYPDVDAAAHRLTLVAGTDDDEE